MHLWLLLSAALAFVPQRSVPAIRGLQAVVEDIDALSFRELQAACKERGLPARGATDVLRERLREHLADAPSDTDAIDLDAALAARALLDGTSSAIEQILRAAKEEVNHFFGVHNFQMSTVDQGLHQSVSCKGGCTRRAPCSPAGPMT